MTSSSVPLSLLSKGIGQLSKNGHERLDVYLEPEDYYNLDSKYHYQLQAIRQQAAQTELSNRSNNGQNKLPLHKTFLTRKGALLLFSEELAKKTLEEERHQRETKMQKVEHDMKSYTIPETSYDKIDPVTESLKTCNDLSWAILSYGRKPDYRKKGDELYLRFIHEPRGNFPERRIRPGFSPKRYISTWSKYWDEGMLQKLRTGGLISDKTLYRQNPLLPHLYKYATYNLAAIPPPYRVTKNMLLAPGSVPSYEFYRVKAPHPTGSVTSYETASRAHPPSQYEAPQAAPIPVGSIQAVKYHESGEIQEVTYSDLKPQEKQEILAELLIAAHEHQQHIRDTLELVISSNRPRGGSERGGSSSAASELMVDMQRAILSLVESPIRQQMKERQRLLQEQEERMQEEKRLQELKEEKRQKRREERKAKKVAEKAAAKKAVEEAAAKRAAEKAAVKKAAEQAKLLEEAKATQRAKEKQMKAPIPEVSQEATVLDPKEEEKRLKEERKKKRREEREGRRKMREEKAAQEEKKKKEEEESRRLAEDAAAAERPPFRDEPRPPAGGDSGKHRRHRRHHHHADEAEKQNDDRGDEKRNKHERRSRRKAEKEAQQSHQEAVQTHIVLSQTSAGDTQVFIQPSGEKGQTKYVEQVEDTFIIPEDGYSEIQHASKDERRKLHRRNAANSIPTQVPTNTPATDTRAYTKAHAPQPGVGIEYDEVIVIEQPRRRRSHGSSIEQSPVVDKSGTRVPVEMRDGEHQFVQGPRSITSSQSSGPKQILFAPDLPQDETSSQHQGSFYGGRMPITSNLVKQTLSDKVSILSASQDSGSVKEGSHQSTKASSEPSVHAKKSHRSTEDKAPSERIVPSIGIEPATPMHPNIKASISPNHLSVLSGQSQSVAGTQYLSPSGSISGSHHSFPKGSGPDGRDRGSQRSRKSLDGSDGRKSSERLPSKKSDSDGDDSDHSDNASRSSHSTEQRSVKREVASKSSQTISSKSKSKKSKQASLLSDDTSSSGGKLWSQKDGEIPYYGLKGQKGPGSQSSASILKSTSSKKSHSTRGSLPSAMKRVGGGTVKMPDGEVVSVGGSLAPSSVAAPIESETEEESDDSISVSSKASVVQDESEHISLPKPVLKSAESEMSDEVVSSVKEERRVSFQEVDTAASHETTEEDEDALVTSEVEETDYASDEETEDEEDAGWPVVEEVISHGGTGTSSGSRPVSSRSEKLTAHAQKIAAIVVKKQRPESGLDDDAKAAAVLWNETIQKEESTIMTSDIEDDESEVGKKQSVTGSSVTTESQAVDADVSSEDEEEDQRRQSRLKKILAEKMTEKEIRPSVSTVPSKKAPSLSDSLSSIQSSVSSVQETFVSEIQRKASALGIEPQDLEFQADVVHKLEKSDITPDEVEVVHDKEAGRHVVRSRRSSTTVSSVLTPSSVENQKETPREVKPSEPPAPKQKLVVDLVLDKQPPASESRASSVTTSVTSPSPTSQLHTPRSSVTLERRRSSIPVDRTEIVLDYDVTTYEGKLGDPKPEEPIIQSGRPHIEPQKIKHTEPKAAPDAASTKVKPSAISKEHAAGMAESVKSSQSAASKPISKGKKPGKQPIAATKGPQRKGQAGVGKAEEKPTSEVAESVAASEELTEDEKLQRDLAKITQSQKNISKKSDAKKKKPPKGKSKPVEGPPSEKEVQRTTPEKPPAKTPETPFKAGRPKEEKPIEDMSLGNTPDELAKQESIASISKSKKGDKTSKKGKKKPDPITQVEVDTPKSKEGAAKKKDSVKIEESTHDVSKAETPAKESEISEEPFDDFPPVAETPDDDYEFIRKEDTPEPEPEIVEEPEAPPAKLDDAKSQTSEVTELTEATEVSSQAAAQAAEDEAEKEAKMAAKQEREMKRAAAAERRRLDVERKRKEKEEQLRKEKEELERQEQMREELEAERRKREEATRMKKAEAERAKQREKEEEELRQKRLVQQQERERKQQEEYRRKMEEVQRKKREEEERKRAEALQEAAEAEERRKEEEEMMAQMEQSERELYEQRKREEEAERKRKEEDRRKREEEEAKIRMEEARLRAIIKAKEQAELEEKLRFIREFFTEASGLDQTQNVNRSFTFSYFELMQMLGLDVVMNE